MDLVSRLLVHDPNERLGANNTIDNLKRHPFFEGVDWENLWTQPAPKLMPYLPPSPAFNTEPLRSDHDACLWDVNRAGETLMAVDPFRELGDSGSSVGHSDQSVNDSDEGLHKGAGALEATRPSASAGPTHGIASTSAVATTATTSRSLPELADSNAAKSGSKTGGQSAPLPKSTSASAAISSSTSSNKESNSAAINGHTKAKSSSSKNAFVALFSQGPKNSAGKKLQSSNNSKKSSQAENLHRDRSRKADITRENSSASLAVTASEISAYSRKTQWELQSELSPWQSFLLQTELIIFQTPVIKRKGLFSRSCILVLTDFPRLLYFDDSNHYYSQVFYSNTNDAYSSWQQQQRVIQWEQLEQQQQQFSLHQQLGGLSLDTLQQPHAHRFYYHPSLSQESQNHQQQQLNAMHQPLQHSSSARRNVGGKDLPLPAPSATTGSGFLLARNGSSKQMRHQQSRSEHIPGQGVSDHQTEELVSGPSSIHSARGSIDHTATPPHHYQQNASHLAHNRQQSNGHNKIDVEKPGTTSATSSLTNSVTPGQGPSSGSSQVVVPSKEYSRSVDGNSNISGISKNSTLNTTVGVPPVTPSMIKASKKQAKLRGEILFTASVVSEVKGKKCFFIHTTKKSYYFEEYREGDAKLWIKVLERCMEEWFGERSGASGGASGSVKEFSNE
ncbi:hypothetical protein BGZ46_002858 [Entomortierella lignicola]|nr:hypothetical protein BGZ46_002858 [Entomortierella lignicola]